MATWQSTLYLVSNHALRANPGRAVTLIPLDSDEECHEWWHPTVPPAVLDELATLLSPGPTLSHQTFAFGFWDGNRIELEVGAAPKSSVYIRFDLRTADPHFFNCVIDLAGKLDSSILTEEGCVVPATHEALIGALRESRAAAFCRDPGGYIESHVKGARII